jgi:hypothetical protein
MKTLRQLPRTKNQFAICNFRFAICNFRFAICNGSAPIERRGGRGWTEGKPRPARLHRGSSKRRGLTLYEVILAVAIFFPALVVLGQGIATGSRAGIQARLQTQAVLRAESVLAEVLAGVWPMESAAGMAFDDAAPGWTWDLEVLAGPHLHLLELQVTANYMSESGTTTTSCTLSRYVRDPQLYIDAAALQAAEAEAQAAAAGTTP